MVMCGKIVINSKENSEENASSKSSDEDFERTSCLCLKRRFFVRKWLIHLVHWPWFERVSMLVILVNCVCLAWADPVDRDCADTKCRRLRGINVFVLWFFVAEMIVKMTAMGIFGKKSYFSEGWNRLDFLIVVAGLVDEFSGLDGAFLVTIRLVRVLRPLRAINRVPSIRILVTLLLEALPLLASVFALAFLVLFVFGIVGVQLWQGVLRNRCFVDSASLEHYGFTDVERCYYKPSNQPDFLCSLPSDFGTKHCPETPDNDSSCVHADHLTSGNYCDFKSLPRANYTCKQDGPNPFYATVSFDNIGYAWMAIFQIITLEGWSDIMYTVQEAHSYWNWIYFVILILLGPFFFVNLCLVVIAMQFQETKTRELQLLEEDRLRKLEAQNVFKKTRWGKVLSVMKTNLSESLNKKSEQHIHHHHHFHHYYHHEHVVQNPLPPSRDSGCELPSHTLVVSHESSVTHTPQVKRPGSDAEAIANPTVLISHQSSISQSSPVIGSPTQEQNDSIISLELTSNCKVSQNFLSPRSQVSDRLSPSWSVKSASSEQVCFSPNTAVSCSCNRLAKSSSFHNVASASASASVSVNVSSSKDEEDATSVKNNTKTELAATARAKATASSRREKEEEETSFASQPVQEIFPQVIIKNKNPRDSSSSVVRENPIVARRNSLKTLNVHALSVSEAISEGGSETLQVSGHRSLYRKRSNSFGEDKITSAHRSPCRRSSDRSLDDRFGSMFDIQRYGLYVVSGERTNWRKLQDICTRLARSATLINFIMIVILINTVIMATQHYQQPRYLEEFQEISNFIFISIFSLELIIKLVGEGIHAYVSQWFNIFDGFILIVSIVEVIIVRGSGGLSVLRSIRLLRIFRLIRPIRHQLIVMVHTMTSVMTFTALLFLFMFTFTVLGMNLFGGRMRLPTSNCTMEKARANFDTFHSAMITIFQVLTLEDWNVVMQDAMRSTTHWAAIYFIILTIIGYYVLFNLLVAILVEGFTNPLLFDCRNAKKNEVVQRLKTPVPTPKTDWLTLIRQAKEQPSLSQRSSADDETVFHDLSKFETEENDNKRRFSDSSNCETKEADDQPNAFKTSLNYFGPALRGVIGQPFRISLHGTPTKKANDQTENLPEISKIKQQSLSKRKTVGLVELVGSGAQSRGPVKNLLSFGQKSVEVDHDLSQNNNGFSDEERNVQQLVRPKIVEPCAVEKTLTIMRRNSCIKTTSDSHLSRSLFLFSQNNSLRRLMIHISGSRLFDSFVLFLIVVSCGFMVVDHPDTDHVYADVLKTASLVFTILFTVEVVVKVIAQGFVIGKDTYLRNGWNILDFVIVIVSWLHILVLSFNSTSPGILGSIKVLRALRTLRPLRMIRRAPGLKLVVGALIHSLKPIGNTVLIAGIFFIVFGILGVQLFKGKFYHCDGDPDVAGKTECLDREKGKWVNRPYNFDNLAEAFVTLFVLATRDGWVTVMHHGIDGVNDESQPVQDYQEWRALYFVAFLMVVGFLVLNMVVGIVVNNYQICHEKQERTEAKRKLPRASDTAEIVNKTRNDRLARLGALSFRGRCFRLCHNKYWDIAVAFFICLSVSLMALEHYNMSDEYKLLLDINNYFCTGIFLFEAFVKLSALGCRRYFLDRWNLLDFLVLVFSVADIIVDLVHDARKISVKPIVIRSLRILRIIRMLKLFKVAKGLRSLLDTVIKALPQVANLGIVLFLLFFIYSLLGIQLFGSIVCSKDYHCYGLSSHANFRSFSAAMLTLFRVSTGDNWNTIFMDTFRSSKYMAPVYFTTFVLATHFVLLNVLVAVLMKDLKASREKLAAVLTRETLDKRVLKMTMSATRFVKQKAFARKSRSLEGSNDGQIELQESRGSLAPD